jgi:hypothetical protein
MTCSSQEARNESTQMPCVNPNGPTQLIPKSL